MKISYERTGGFAGMRVGLDLDLQHLPSDEAAALKDLVKAADFFHLTQATGPGAIPDGFQHAITVEEDSGHKRTILVGDSSVSDSLRPLLDDLTVRARSQRKAG